MEVEHFVGVVVVLVNIAMVVESVAKMEVEHFVGVVVVLVDVVMVVESSAPRWDWKCTLVVDGSIRDR
ncbi:hypothetical protein NL676_035400 [Syzygium grande]|nr:hypothetical protein NL676_035400 [Syzygium grande]